MANSQISGIHHITAIAGNPQANVDFYTGVLGLRLVKKTVNFYAPETYHLYYGDRTGNPGTVLTFFPWGEGAWRGKAGTGQVTVISFAVPVNALAYWMERLELEDVSFQGPLSRFDEEVVTLRDPDGIQLELVATQINHGTPQGVWLHSSRQGHPGISQRNPGGTEFSANGTAAHRDF